MSAGALPDPMVPPGAPRPPRILIAEDDTAAAAVLQTLLGRVGYDVEVAPDGATALRLLEESPAPDVLLLDWMLPEVSGLEVCQQVRQRWDPLSLPILMVTAKTDADSIAAAFEAGASDYLTKPFLGAELRSRIASHLRLKQLVEERRRVDEHLMEREKLSTLGLLVSGVAHDLNNPLAGILGQAQLLLEEEDEPEKLGMLRQIVAEVQRCNQIVGDLLSFSRRRPGRWSQVDVAAVARKSMALREQPLRAAGVRVEVELPGGLPRLRGNAHQLQQVFLNIVINAEHALRQAGGSLRVAARATYRTSADGGAGEWVEVAFRNDGPPIPAETLPHIFDAFFTTKSDAEGTGLGLAICQRIVREHGGEIQVESGADGTVFRVLLPVTEPAPA